MITDNGSDQRLIDSATGTGDLSPIIEAGARRNLGTLRHWPRDRSRRTEPPRMLGRRVRGARSEAGVRSGLRRPVRDRVAGNIVSPSQIGSVEFAAGRYGTRLVVVMGHSRRRRDLRSKS